MKRDFKAEYYSAFYRLRDEAERQIKNYRHTLDLRKIAEKDIIGIYGNGCEEDDIQSWLCEKCYYVFFIDKHNTKHYCRITAVRYYENGIEVRIEDDDINLWLRYTMIDGDSVSIYLTILDFIQYEKDLEKGE